MCKDQKWGKGSQGKEICDLLVVFENYIIIFSDKYCRFPSSGDLELDWSRWFKRAVWKSANQIWGAERWLRDHPTRIFLDRACTKPFPIPLPPSETASVIRIVVAHGSGECCKSFFGGSGSLIIEPEIVGRHHFDPKVGAIAPFRVGRLDEKKGFVHVIDDLSLDVLLRTLDTTPDFIRYLQCKEDFINSGSLGMAAGEEELLAYYLTHTDDSDKHDFVFPKNYNSMLLGEGFWENFRNHADRAAQIKENQISYAWDRLIDHFTFHIMEGKTQAQSHSSIAELEAPLRFMARETRTKRRMLAKGLLGILEKGAENDRAARVFIPVEPGDPFYVFLSFKAPPDKNYEEYQMVRRGLLEAYCKVVRHQHPEAMDIVGCSGQRLLDTC